MDLLSAEFFSALLAIVVIDLVLAGDNAIVIALAARRLPPALQRKAVLWGSVGAVVVRSVMTLAVVWLLKVPGLLLAGGAMLLWIAFKLLSPDDGHGEDKVAASTTFLGAMKTIVIADAVMGVDNVLAVAGAAHGSYLLVVLGLLISVPIVVWGSTFLLKLTERFPIIVSLGAGVLAFTGVKMMLSEPLVKPWVGTSELLTPLAYLLGVGGVLGLGHARQSVSRLANALAAHQERFALPSRPAKTEADLDASSTDPLPSTVLSTPLTALSTDALTLPTPLPQGENTMPKILVPVDGSRNAMAALRQAMRTGPLDSLQLLLVNVQPTLTRRIGRFVSGAERDSWRKERAEAATREARAELARHGVRHDVKMVVGERVEAIKQAAMDSGVDKIVMGTARKNSITRLVENSVTSRLLDESPVPVEIVTGTDASRWERWGLPATLGAALAAAMAVAD